MNQRGFTLIELMIVVAIVGILAAVALPKFCEMINHKHYVEHGTWRESCPEWIKHEFTYDGKTYASEWGPENKGEPQNTPRPTPVPSPVPIPIATPINIQTPPLVSITDITNSRDVEYLYDRATKLCYMRYRRTDSLVLIPCSSLGLR